MSDAPQSEEAALVGVVVPSRGFTGVPPSTHIDPSTGFMESSRHDGITAVIKTSILESYRQTGNLSLACRSSGVQPRTIRWHCSHDPAFAACIDEVREELSDRAEGSIVNYMESPKGFMDRIAWLRAHRREKWGQTVDANVTHSVKLVKNLTRIATDYEGQP